MHDITVENGVHGYVTTAEGQKANNRTRLYESLDSEQKVYEFQIKSCQSVYVEFLEWPWMQQAVQASYFLSLSSNMTPFPLLFPLLINLSFTFYFLSAIFAFLIAIYNVFPFFSHAIRRIGLSCVPRKHVGYSEDDLDALQYLSLCKPSGFKVVFYLLSLS